VSAVTWLAGDRLKQTNKRQKTNNTNSRLQKQR
jgi:hypothetical protein